MLNGTFWYNGRCSDEFNLKIGYTNTDSFSFGVERENVIETIPHSYQTYNLGSTYKSLEKNFVIYTPETLTTKKRIEICDWLFVDKFCELYSQGQTDIVYYCKLEGETNKFLGCNGGYIECKMICNSPFAWTRPRVTKRSFDPCYVQNSSMSSIVNIRNDSNYKSWGDFIVQLHTPSKTVMDSVDEKFTKNDFTIKIWNKTNTLEDDALIISSKLSPLMPLEYNELITIDMNNHLVFTNCSTGVLNSASNVYQHRLENSNRKFLTLNKGMNEIEIQGFCSYQIITQFPILQ